MTLGTALLVIAVLYLIERNHAWQRAALFTKRAAIVTVIGAIVAAGGYLGWQKYHQRRVAKAEAAKPWGNATVIEGGGAKRAMVKSLSLYIPANSFREKYLIYCGKLQNDFNNVTHERAPWEDPWDLNPCWDYNDVTLDSGVRIHYEGVTSDLE